MSALCWVSRGYAKAELEEYEPNEEEIAEHQKMSKKLLKGKDIQKTDIGAAAKEMQDNMDNMDMSDYDDDAPNDAPIFTSELAAMI